MALKSWCSVVRQRTLENTWIVHSGLLLFMTLGFLQALLGRRQQAIDALSQVHRTARFFWFRRVVEPYILANLAATYRDPQTLPKPNLSACFGNRLMVLKAPAAGGEKGVLFVMVNDPIRSLHSGMNLPKLLGDYTLIFEPSWSGYCHRDLLEFTRWNEQIFTLTAEEGDLAFLKRLDSNLIPVDLGPCDWVDPRTAEPYLKAEKKYDIAMNSNWGAWKRHYVLFHMLRHAKQRYKVALIGFQWSGRVQADVERLADYYGVSDQLTFFDWIPLDQVMDLVCSSRVSILLSLKEGSNRTTAESIFCNVPVVVLASHVGGIRKNVVPETGLLVEEANLESAIADLLESNLQPRQWGLQNISCFKSTERLNALLREYALKQGRPWTQDIAVRSNSPESSYADPEDTERFRPWNEGLKDYLRQ